MKKSHAFTLRHNTQNPDVFKSLLLCAGAILINHGEKMKDIETIFSDTFGNRSRFKILGVLAKGPQSVTGITKLTGIEQTTISHNLRFLSKSKIVECTVYGRHHIYHINEGFAGFVDGILKDAKRHEKGLKKGGILAILVLLAFRPLLTQELPLLGQSASLITTFKLACLN